MDTGLEALSAGAVVIAGREGRQNRLWSSHEELACIRLDVAEITVTTCNSKFILKIFLRAEAGAFKEVDNTLSHRTKTLQGRIVSGSVVLLTGSGLTTATNMAYNVMVARYLGPQGFGHATVVYTLLILLSAVTLSFQIVATKVVAQQQTAEGKTAVYRYFHQGSWVCGIGVGLALLCFQNPISSYLNLSDPMLVGLIAIGAAFYVPLGCRRGYLQGLYGFRGLAYNMILEGLVRLIGSFGLILMGSGVRGVIVANSAAIAVSYFAIRVKLSGHEPNPLSKSYAARETCQALVFFAGQMLINNCGIVLVDHFFAAREAGIYAAVAMVGRVIFAFSQAVVNTTFPLVAGTREEDRKDLRVIATSLLMVLGTGSVISLALCFAPARLWTMLFGAGFEIVGRYNIPYLLAMYAFATVIYCLSGVIITFEMSYKIANTSWVQLLFSGVLIAGICRYHSSLRETILVQLALMAILFVLVAVPFLVNSLTDPTPSMQAGMGKPVRLLRRVSEDEVIAEFLKSDFHCATFRDYQSMSEIVLNPNLDDADENAKRRALLFLRHLSLWKEIPSGTEWYEAEISEADLGNIRIFPRAQWRKVARQSFSATDVVTEMRKHNDVMDPSFVAKIADIRRHLMNGTTPFGAVLLIGVGENEPLTVLDGNHRLVASLLESPSRLQGLRFLCGLSPKMAECCWYNTNFVTLFRYGRNVLTHAMRNPEAELARLLRNPS